MSRRTPDQANTYLRLTISSVVLTYVVMEARLGIDYGYLRVRVELINRDFVGMAEYFTVQTGVVTVPRYRCAGDLCPPKDAA